MILKAEFPIPLRCEDCYHCFQYDTVYSVACGCRITMKTREVGCSTIPDWCPLFEPTSEDVPYTDFGKMNDLPKKIASILVDVGQSDSKFKLGETIKYSPSEVEDILRKHIVDLF